MPIDRARRSAKFVIGRLRSNVEQQRNLLYPGDHAGPGQWLGLINGLLDTADLYLDRSRGNGSQDSESISLIRESTKLATEAYEMFAEFRGSDTGELAFPIVAPLQRWFDQLQIGNSTFFRANLEANYELHWWKEVRFAGIRDPAPSLQEAIKEIHWPLFRVTVPAKAFGVVPHLAIVAHEIGHAVHDQLPIDSTLANALLTAIVRRLKEEYPDSKPSDLSEAAREVLDFWLAELSADAVMFLLTGPAGFFAFCDCMQLEGAVDDFSRTHPPSAIRRQILFSRMSRSEAGKQSFLDVFKKHTSQDLTEAINSPSVATTLIPAEIRKRAARQHDSKPLHPEAISILVGAIIEAEDLIYDAVASYVTSISPSCIYTPERFDHDLSTHLEPLYAVVPPVEFGDKLDSMNPVDFASILNVGWVALICGLNNLRIKPRNSDPFLTEKMESLNGLLLKAVELSEARRTWKSI